MRIDLRCVQAIRSCTKLPSFLFLIAMYGCGGSGDPGTTLAPGFDLPPPVGPFPSVRFAPCPPDVGSNGLRCGVLDTYENYEKTGSDARIIQVAFGILPAATTPAAPDPIVLIEGGPGVSPLVQFGRLPNVEAFTNDRELILVDQRGAGFSRPFLHCDNIRNADAEARSCVQSFVQQGVDLSQYRSAVIAQDFKALREALEIQQWNVYGLSYGPVPGILYAELDPAGVRSVIFDSSNGNQVDVALADAAAPLDFVSELAAQCAAETECANRMTDLRSIFIDTFRSLENDPWIVESNLGLIEYNSRNLFTAMGSWKATQYPAVLEMFANRNSELLLQTLPPDNNTTTDNNLSNRSFAELMSAVVDCASIDAENFSSATVPTRDQWPDELVNFARNDVGYAPFCNSGIVDIEQDLLAKAPRFLDVPALILGGALDEIVSIKRQEKFSESFATPRLAIVPRGGHVVGYPTVDIDLCVKGIMARFLENPEDAPEMTCLTNNVEPFLFGEAFIESL